MTLDELRPILAAYRKQVEPAWSPATCHPGYDGKAGDPAGQCGVTSAWLQRRLREDHGIETTYCVGSVYLNHRVVNGDHCWLEIGYDEDALVVDLTAGQMPGVSDLKVLYAAHWELLLSDICYLARSREWFPPADDPVQPRLAILTEALS